MTVPAADPTSAGDVWPMLAEDWDKLVAQLAAGDCTPFLGAGACSGTLPSGTELSAEWAGKTGYPFADTGALPSVMDYAFARYQDPVYVKSLVAGELADRGYPDFDDPDEPHVLLAGCDLPVYLTTNYDDFMAKALKRRGKVPRVLTCPWYEGAPPCPELEQPIGASTAEPVVFHLHGNAADPSTMVLGERDYVEFLRNLMMDYGSDDRRVVPAAIRLALTRKTLLFLGYSLRDWTFITLFDGLLKTVADVQKRPHISVQLPPSDVRSQERAQEYLSKRLAPWNVSVHWCDVAEFCRELRERLR